MREEFEAEQLTLVKKRWNILTAAFIIISTFVGLTSISDSKTIIGALVNLGDCVLVGIVMSLLGWKWKNAHNFSLPVLIFVRGVC